ncbi:MAG TPA: OB-fold nucleic acid binding domain-containing protein, partial [Vicinamibacterales bacterium]|nr:OB-fold nucleic acid binding domain-containing protein [Vicinamibacterales bacterium]
HGRKATEATDDQGREATEHTDAHGREATEHTDAHGRTATEHTDAHGRKATEATDDQGREATEHTDAHGRTATEHTDAHGRTATEATDDQGSRWPAIAAPEAAARFASLDDLIRRTGVHRDELATLASVGALNAFGYDRRTALWQIEQAIRPAGELFETPEPSQSPKPKAQSPLSPMTVTERLLADYEGTSLTIGPHPMSLRRGDLALRGVLRASDLPRGRHGRRVRVAGAVITRQRPGTAKGFVFLTLEDETGIANIIVRPDLFTAQRATIVGEPYLLVEGLLQIQEGVTSVKAERLSSLGRRGPAPESHDFR